MLCPRSLLCFLAAFICLLDTHAVEGSPAVEGNGSANRRADDGSQLIDFSLSDDTHIDEEDAYICIPVEFPKEEGFIIKYEQFFDAAYVHHALMFGCPEPVNKQQWSCPHGSQFCHGGQTTMYAWGKHAAPMHIPEGVGFRVGGGSNSRWGVLQVHALLPTKSVAKQPNTLVAHYTTVPPLYIAGFLLMYYSGFVTIPPNQRDWGLMSKGCTVNTGGETLQAFMFRTHTHEHGRMVSAYLKKNGESESKLLEERDPQKPQAFVPISNAPVPLTTGDEFRFKCKFDTTNESNQVSMGPTHTDEMCNFYLVFYAKKPFSFLCDEDGSISNMDIAPLQTQLPDTCMPVLTVLADASTMFPGEGTRALLGGVAGVAIHRPTGDLFVFHRGQRIWDAATFNSDNTIADKTLIQEDVILRLDAGTGAVLSRFGAGTFSMPHGITVTDDGHVWVTDVGLHQVMQFNLYGEHILTLGEKFKPTEFCKPTQVGIGKDGRVFITDGYCHSRIAVYDQETQKISTLIGTTNEMSPMGQNGERDPTFKLPHGIAVHPIDGSLFVADRQNERVVVLNKDGKFVKVFKKKYGPVYGLTFGKDGSFYITSDKSLFRVDPSNGNVLWQTGDYMMGHAVAVHVECGSIYLARTAKDDKSLTMYLTNDAKMTIGPNSCFTRFKGITIDTDVDDAPSENMAHAHHHGGGDPATAIQPQDHAHGPAVSPNPEEHAHNPVHDPPKTEMDDMMENMDDTEDDLAEQAGVASESTGGHDHGHGHEDMKGGEVVATEEESMLDIEDEEEIEVSDEPPMKEELVDKDPPATEDEMDDGDGSGALSSIQASVDGFINTLKEKKEELVPSWADKYTAGVIALVLAVTLAGVMWYKGCGPCNKGPASRRDNDEENQDRVALVDYRRIPRDEDEEEEILHTVPNGFGSANGNASLPEAMSCDADGWDDEHWSDDDDVIVKGAAKRAD